jgi:hypothetical protein
VNQVAFADMANFEKDGIDPAVATTRLFRLQTWRLRSILEAESVWLCDQCGQPREHADSALCDRCAWLPGVTE